MWLCSGIEGSKVVAFLKVTSGSHDIGEVRQRPHERIPIGSRCKQAHHIIIESYVGIPS